MNHCVQQIGLWKTKWSYKRKTLSTSSCSILRVQVLVVMSLGHEGTACLCLMLKLVMNRATFAISIFMFVTYFYVFSM